MSVAEARPLISAGFDRIAAVRDEIGGERDLLVGCHWRLPPHAVEDVLRFAQSQALCWVETPIAEDADRYDDIVAIRAKANRLGLRLAGGELKTGTVGFLPLIERELYDVVMPDMTFVGGYRAYVEVAASARKHGVAVSIHNPTGPVCHGHSVQAAAATPGHQILETQFDETPAFAAIVEGDLPLPIDGAAHAPSAPGLGLRLLQGAFAAFHRPPPTEEASSAPTGLP